VRVDVLGGGGWKNTGGGKGREGTQVPSEVFCKDKEWVRCNRGEGGIGGGGNLKR